MAIHKIFSRTIACALLAVASAVPAVGQPVDPMMPTSSVEDATVSPLATVSLTVANMDETRKFFQGAMGLVPYDVSVEGDEARKLTQHWGLPESNQLTVIVFRNPYAAGSADVRAIEVNPNSPTARPNLSSRYIGTLGFGLPMAEIAQREAIASIMGFESTAGISSMNFSRADGSTYPIEEIHFVAPDDIMVLGVDRGEQAQIGELDPVLDMGGVAYSSFLVEDLERSGAFLRHVLGFELRRETTFRSAGTGGGMLDMRAGEEVAFNQWFSSGARSGYLVEMKLLDGGRVPRVAEGFSTRGIAAYTFTTPDLDLIARRWQEYGGETRPIYEGSIPGFGPARALMIETPDGIPVEILELRAAESACSD